MLSLELELLLSLLLFSLLSTELSLSGSDVSSPVGGSVVDPDPRSAVKNSRPSMEMIDSGDELPAGLRSRINRAPIASAFAFAHGRLVFIPRQVKPRLVSSGVDLVEQLYLSELKFGE